MGISAEKLRFYQENGYVVVENVVAPDTLEKIRRKIEELTEAASEERGLPTGKAQGELVQREGAGDGGTAATKVPLRKLNFLAPLDPFFLQIARSPEIVEVAARLAGDARRLMLYSDQVFLKPAFCGSEKPIHQDNSYFRVTPFTHGVTCWMAVDEATVENGCLNYVPGSHKLGLLNHKSISAAHLVPDVNFPLGQEIPVPVKAGSCIFHHLLTLHNSKANTSDKPRRSWALHYANRDATSAVKPWDEMIVVKE